MKMPRNKKLCSSYLIGPQDHLSITQFDKT